MVARMSNRPNNKFDNGSSVPKKAPSQIGVLGPMCSSWAGREYLPKCTEAAL
jgi:hypothetical protein